jgi:effector-binding domain-containing protein
MFKLALTATGLVIVAMILYLLLHLGIQKPVQIELATAPTLKLLYKEHVGSYYKINEKIQAVEAWAQQNQIPCALTFGEYIDDPASVEEERLRSHGGCIVESEPANKPADFSYKEIPERKVIKATFEGSPAIGPYKVYNKVQSFRLENRLIEDGPVIETYEVHADQKMTTRYLFPIK